MDPLLARRGFSKLISDLRRVSKHKKGKKLSRNHKKKTKLKRKAKKLTRRKHRRAR